MYREKGKERAKNKRQKLTITERDQGITTAFNGRQQEKVTVYIKCQGGVVVGSFSLTRGLATVCPQ